MANRTVSDGSYGPKCPQALPEWALQGVTGSGDGMKPNGEDSTDGGTSEDCLFLDVFVSQEILEDYNSPNPGKHRYPVRD